MKVEQQSYKHRYTKYRPKWCKYPEFDGVNYCWGLATEVDNKNLDNFLKDKCDICEYSEYFNKDKFEYMCYNGCKQKIDRMRFCVICDKKIQRYKVGFEIPYYKIKNENYRTLLAIKYNNHKYSPFGIFWFCRKHAYKAWFNDKNFKKEKQNDEEAEKKDI